MRLSYSVFTSYMNCVVFIGVGLFLLFIGHNLLLLHILIENANLKQFFFNIPSPDLLRTRTRLCCMLYFCF